MRTKNVERSLALLRQAGYLPAVVERYNAAAGCRQDLWNFADILACPTRPSSLLVQRLLFVQVCARGEVEAHNRKLKREPRVQTVLRAGHRVEIWGWALRCKVRANGKKIKQLQTWQCDRFAVTL